MADLLGSILGSMEKPPSADETERKRRREMQKRMEKIKEQEKERINKFRARMQQTMEAFIKEPKKENMKLEPMDKVFRAIVHEVAEVAGLASFSFGQEEVDRYVIVWKKEFAPCDEELSCYRRGEVWDPEKAKQQARLRESEKHSREVGAAQKAVETPPAASYREKYTNMMKRAQENLDAGAQSAGSSRSYGLVSYENKMDKRTIEQVMADNRVKKKMRTEQSSTSADS